MSTWDQYAKIRTYYRDPGIAGTYEARRFCSPMGRFRNARVLAAVGRALDHAASKGFPVEHVLDLPIGTGRLVPLLLERKLTFVGGDLSPEMMQRAVEKMAHEPAGGALPFTRCDAEALPFKDEAFDATVTLRFLFHLPRDLRVEILAELRRVSRRWVILDCRNKWNPGFVLRKAKRSLGLGTPDRLFWSKADIQAELSESGIKMVRIFPATAYLSDQWIVLGEKSTWRS